MRVFMDTYEPHTFMYISDWGSVGAGLPIAMGVKLARPKQAVMAAVGDMGMMCNIGELETAVREKIPVVCVVYNDRGLGNERAFQKELYGGRLFARGLQRRRLRRARPRLRRLRRARRGTLGARCPRSSARSKAASPR